MTPRTKAGADFLDKLPGFRVDHISDGQLAAMHVRAIEDEMLDKVAAAVGRHEAHFHCDSCMSAVLAAIEDIRKEASDGHR